MHLREIKHLLTLVEYKDWMIRSEQDANGRMWLQWRFYAPNSYTGEKELQSCRKWFLSEHMTRSEIICTAFKAALSAEEHECRETFKYKDQAVFGPHIDVDIMAEQLKDLEQNALDNRKKAG